jgi:hypothetical protein
MSPLIFVSAARTRDRPSRHRVTADQDSSPRQNDANHNMRSDLMLYAAPRQAHRQQHVSYLKNPG